MQRTRLLERGGLIRPWQIRLRLGRTAALLLGSACLLIIDSCASVGGQPWYGDARVKATEVAATVKKGATVGAREASSVATSAYDRMQHYLAEKDVLRTFTDASEQGEQDVLAMLHRKRVSVPRRSTAAGPVASPPAGSGVASALPAAYQGQLRWPLDAGIVSSEFGQRGSEMHKGLDIAADRGEPVYAAADGQVIYAGDGLRGYGNVVIVQHDRHLTTLYAHNSSLKVTQGQHVSKGNLIALLGSTGHSTGPHVHFEVRRDDAAVSPRSVLPKSMVAESASGAKAAAAKRLVSRGQ